MNLKSTLIVSAALLFVTAPAWADSMKTTASTAASSFSSSDIKRLGGFKTQDSRLLDVEPDGDADDASAISAPEPGSLGLLFTGLLCIGALARGSCLPPRSVCCQRIISRRSIELISSRLCDLGEFFFLEERSRQLLSRFTGHNK